MWNPESWVLESGVQLKESGLPLAINPESVTWNPESQTIVDSLIGQLVELFLLDPNTLHDAMFSF